MKPFLTWARRGAGAPLALAVLAFVITQLLSEPSSYVELDWSVRFMASSLFVVNPCVAAVVAFEASRRLRPTTAALSLGSVRSGWAKAIPAWAVVLWVLLAYAVCWALAVVLVVRRSGVGATDIWVYPEVASAVLAAALVGLLVGGAATARWAAPLAALVVLGGNVVLAPWGRGPFQVVSTTGTMTGLERPATRAVAAILAALVVAAAALALSSLVQRPGKRPRLLIGCCVVALLVAAVGPTVWPWRQDVYVVTAEPYGCIGSAPAVCGPASRLPLLKPVQTALAEAYRTLAGTDFTRPTAFRVTRVDHYSDLDGAAPLDFDPAAVRDGRYTIPATARALIRPHQCRGLYDARTAPALLDSGEVTLSWLEPVLAGQAPVRPVPPGVESAFRVILNCDVMTGDLH